MLFFIYFYFFIFFFGWGLQQFKVNYRDLSVNIAFGLFVYPK